MHRVVAVMAGAVQRLFQLVEANAAVAVAIEFGKDIVGRGDVGAAGAERVLELLLGDRAVSVAVDLREQVLQRLRWVGGRRVARARLALGGDQRAHGLRRDLRPRARASAEGATRRRAWAAVDVERACRGL